MPVVGRDDRHDVDIFAVEDLAVIFIDGNLPVDALSLIDIDKLVGPQSVKLVDVADGGHVAELLHSLTNSAAPAIPHADASYDRPFAGGVEPQRAAARTGVPIRERCTRQRGQRRIPEEATAIDRSTLHEIAPE